jgi:ribosomal protein S18 acetylase RimI-like enzyme
MIWIAAFPERRRAFIYDFSIHPPYRRKGYGAQALRAVEVKARALGLESIGLHVFGHNRAAQALYEKLGYEVTNINMSKRMPPEG